MSHSYPSIQNCYKREVATEIPQNQQLPSVPGDGFTEEEIAATLDPLNRKFNPTRTYEECSIGSLESGPKAVKFVGRIVNFNVSYGRSKSHISATGWCHLIVRDNTGAICVKAFFSGRPYPLRLGNLMTIWTSFISTTSKHDTTIPNAPLMTNIFPGRDSSVHMALQKGDDGENECRVPLYYLNLRPLPGLMTLKAYLNGAHEVPDSKILVCVKSIGAKKVITTKKGLELELVEVFVFDDTAETILKLWKEMGLSAREWSASETLLLISSPKAHVEFNGKVSLSVGICTFVDVDPQFRDAEWLRNYVLQSRKQDCVSQVWPEGIWDVDAAVNGVNRILFTLGDVDDFIRSNPRQVFTGFLSVIVMELALVVNRQRNMLMCGDCCGVPIFANTFTATCRNCDKEKKLSLNPKIVGGLIDETACIGPGKLLWSEEAWQQLWGMGIQELLELPARETKLLEQRMLFMRITLVFGWAEAVGRLAVLAVME